MIPSDDDALTVAFTQAAEQGDLVTLAQLWNQADVGVRQYGLSRAAVWGRRATVQWLLDQGALPLLEGAEALAWAAQHGWTAEVQRMLTLGANPHDLNDIPFRKACEYGHLATAQALAPHSHLDAADHGGLYLAAIKGRDAVVGWLVQADPEGIRLTWGRLMAEELWAAMDTLAVHLPPEQAQACLNELEGKHLPRTTQRLNALARHTALEQRPVIPSQRRPRA